MSITHRIMGTGLVVSQVGREVTMYMDGGGPGKTEETDWTLIPSSENAVDEGDAFFSFQVHEEKKEGIMGKTWTEIRGERFEKDKEGKTDLTHTNTLKLMHMKVLGGMVTSPGVLVLYYNREGEEGKVRTRTMTYLVGGDMQWVPDSLGGKSRVVEEDLTFPLMMTTTMKGGKTGKRKRIPVFRERAYRMVPAPMIPVRGTPPPPHEDCEGSYPIHHHIHGVIHGCRDHDVGSIPRGTDMVELCGTHAGCEVYVTLDRDRGILRLHSSQTSS